MLGLWMRNKDTGNYVKIREWGWKSGVVVGLPISRNNLLTLVVKQRNDVGKTRSGCKMQPFLGVAYWIRFNCWLFGCFYIPALTILYNCLYNQ